MVGVVAVGAVVVAAGFVVVAAVVVGDVAGVVVDVEEQPIAISNAINIKARFNIISFETNPLIFIFAPFSFI